MPIDKRSKGAAEALADVADGATVFISGFGGAGFPNVLIRALRDRGAKGLTLVVNSATHRYSFTHELIEAGLVRKVVCTAARGHNKDPSPFERLWMEGKIELECVPQGTFAERIRAGGAGIPAFYTPVGFGTELTRARRCAASAAATTCWSRPSRATWHWCVPIRPTATAISPSATRR